MKRFAGQRYFWAGHYDSIVEIVSIFRKSSNDYLLYEKVDILFQEQYLTINIRVLDSDLVKEVL